MTTPVKVGDVIRVREPDYCYGLGDLVLRITAFVGSDVADPEWVTLKGIELAWNGTDRGERVALVRRSAIRLVRP